MVNNRNQQMNLHIAGALTSLSQRASFPDTLMQLIHNSVDAGASKIKVVLYKQGAKTSVCVIDNGYGLFCTMPEEDAKIIAKIESGEIELGNKRVADMMIEATSCISYPYMMALPGESMKRSKVYRHLLELFAEGGGQIPRMTIGAKAIGLLETISKCERVVIRSKPHFYMARHHFNQDNLKHSDLPISVLELPTRDDLLANRRGYNAYEEAGDLHDPINEKVIEHGTIVTLENIADTNWWLSTERLATHFANQLGRWLADNLIEFEFWTIEEIVQKTSKGGRIVVPERKRVSMKNRVRSDESLYHNLIETEKGFVAEIRVWRRSKPDDKPIHFSRSGIPGNAVSETPGFEGVWQDPQLTGYVEILSPSADVDFYSWDQEKRSPMSDFKPMNQALRQISALRSEISHAVDNQRDAHSRSMLSHISSVCESRLRQILTEEDLGQLIGLPPAPIQRDSTKRKRGSKTERPQVGIRVRIKNEYGEAIPDDLQLNVTLVMLKNGLRDPQAVSVPKFGNIIFGEYPKGVYRVEIAIPSGMEITYPTSNEPFSIEDKAAIFKVFVIRTNMPPRIKGKLPALTFEFHAEAAEDPLVNLADLAETGKVYLNIGAPLFRLAYTQKDSIRLAEAIAYPIMMGIFQLAYEVLDQYVIDKAIRLAQELATQIQPELKNSFKGKV